MKLQYQHNILTKSKETMAGTIIPFTRFLASGGGDDALDDAYGEEHAEHFVSPQLFPIEI